MNIIKKKLFISGMTCVNCQNRIEQRLLQTPGIKSARVSYNKGTADVAYDTDEISLKDVICVIEKLDYQVVTKRQEEKPDLERIISLLVLIVALYVLLQQLGILNLLVPNQLADSKMGYGMLFVVGLLTSVHCIAMCGGINLSCCLPRAKSGEEARQGAREGAGKTGKSGFEAFLPAFAYNAGRVISYTVIGLLLGFAGMLLGGGSGGLSVFFQGILKLIAGVFMVIMGINMLDLFPWLKTFNLRMPKAFAVAVGKQKRKGSGPFFIGLLNGLMPCGPLQSMQIVALAAANPLAGALSMFFFSLGTVPLMLGLGSLVAALGRRFTHTVQRVGAVLVTVLGLAMLSQGVSLSGVMTVNQLLYAVIAACLLGIIGSLNFQRTAYKPWIVAACAALILFGMCRMGNDSVKAKEAAETDVAQTVQAVPAETTAQEEKTEQAAGEEAAETEEAAECVQVVNSTLAIGKYPDITVTVGIPVRWIINAPAGSINGCNYKMLIREYGIEHAFQEGENVIEFTPTETGTITYTCWMGMIRANIYVVEPDEAVSDGQDEAAQEAQDAAEPAAQEEAYVSTYQIPTEELAIAEISEDAEGNRVQNVEIALTQDGFSPAVVVVENGVETNWTIKNELSQEGESAELLAALYATILPLAAGDNTLYLYPVESFDVSTGDYAFYAYVKVVEDLNEIDADAIRKEVEEYEAYVYPSSVFESIQSGASCCY